MSNGIYISDTPIIGTAYGQTYLTSRRQNSQIPNWESEKKALPVTTCHGEKGVVSGNLPPAREHEHESSLADWPMDDRRPSIQHRQWHLIMSGALSGNTKVLPHVTRWQLHIIMMHMMYNMMFAKTRASLHARLKAIQPQVSVRSKEG